MLTFFLFIWTLISAIIKNKVAFVSGSGGKELLYKILTLPHLVLDLVVDKFPTNFSQKLTDWFAK